MKIITIANQKGGVAKTTTANYMATKLSKIGKKVLLIDLDPQSNLSESVLREYTEDIYDVLRGEVDINNAIYNHEDIDIIPSSLELTAADMEFVQTGREFKLKKSIQKIKNKYDYIVIDTPPNLGILTVNSFMASDEVIVPVSGFDGAKAVVNLCNTINIVKDFGNPKLEIAGILMTKFNPRILIDKDIRELVLNIALNQNIKVFDTYIRTSIKVDEARANKMSIFEYDAKNNVAVDYENFISEYLENNEV